jgi:hypothetical protein
MNDRCTAGQKGVDFRIGYTLAEAETCGVMWLVDRMDIRLQT